MKGLRFYTTNGAELVVTLPVLQVSVSQVTFISFPKSTPTAFLNRNK